MGEFTSVATSTTSLWSERYANSGTYDQEPFTPSVFEFDINPDSLNVTNLTLSSVGTSIPYIASRNSSTYRRYYVGQNYNSTIRFYLNSHTGLGIYTYVSPSFTDIGWLWRYTYGVFDADYYDISAGFLLGVYYHPESQQYYLFLAGKLRKDGSWYPSSYRVDASDLWDSSELEKGKKWIADNFYGASLPEHLQIKRISPTSLEFTQGQTSQLVYQLVARDIQLETSMMIIPGDVVGLANGWSFDGSVSPPTLSLISSRYRQSIKVSCEYDGITYNLTDVFYPSGFSPYGPGGASGPAGGGGYFGSDEESDAITIPGGTASADASDMGLYTRYLMNSSELDFVGQWLWTDNLGLTIAKAFVSLLYGNPAESLISLMSYPFAIDSAGISTTARNLCWGGHNSGITANVLGNSAASFSWGTIAIKEFWGNFLDYEPHTKIELYLPWGTGFVSIDPGQVMGGSISVTTNVDLNKGSCVHSVFAGSSLIGSYAGQCGQQIPLVSNDYASKVAGVVVAGTALAVNGISGIAAANAGTNAEIAYRKSHPFQLDTKSSDKVIKSFDARQRAIGNAVQEAEAPHRAIQRRAGHVASASSLAATKRSGIVARSGSFTDGSAGLGCQYPYIILSRPSQSVPANYGHHYGYPSNIYMKLGDLKGYTEVGEIHLNGIPATDVELDELDAILKGGVLF